MPRNFKTLVRLNDWEVDQKRRALGEELRQLDNLEGRLKALEEELIREQAKAAEMPTEAGILYGAYAQSVLNRREDLQAKIAEQELAVERARDALAEAYLEFKKYEIAEERRVTAEARALAKEEQTVLDEIGITNYIRKG